MVLACFWQLARHWKEGYAAKLELVCEAGIHKMQLLASLKYPDKPHFSDPNS